MNNIAKNFQVFTLLVKRDLKKFMREFWGKQIDALITVLALSLANGYLLQRMGLSANYGVFFIASTIIAVGYFEIYGNGYPLMMDLEVEKKITYDLTLPIYSWLVLVKQAVVYAIASMLMSIYVLPLGKLLFWSSFDLSQISWWRTILIYVSSNMLFGFMTLWFTSFIKSFDAMSHLWGRFLFPMFVLGASQVPWQTMFNLWPFVGYLTLLNPLVYPMEGIRAAVLGQAGSLPFWLCLSMVWALIGLMGWMSVERLSKRLDLVG